MMRPCGRRRPPLRHKAAQDRWTGTHARGMDEITQTILTPTPLFDTVGDADVEELIRRRAYELFEARGCEPGHALEDWLRAEREIRHHLS